MAKKYKVKDINNNGKIDGWEQGKYDAINQSATKMGYSMKMGDKENYSPTNFKTKDALNISAMPMIGRSKSTDPEVSTIKLDNVDVSASRVDKLSKEKEYKRALQDLGKNVSEQVRTQYSRDSLISNINNNYNPGKFGELSIDNQNTGSSQYNFNLSQGSAAGQPPRVYAYDKKGSSGIKTYLDNSGYTELTNDGSSLTSRRGSSTPLVKELNYYQNLSNQLFKKGKKNIDLKFGFN